MSQSNSSPKLNNSDLVSENDDTIYPLLTDTEVKKILTKSQIEKYKIKKKNLKKNH
jgi:hypothetical protein